MSTVMYRRPARRPPPAMPKGEVLFEQPPELPEVQASAQAQKLFRILPMIAMPAGMAFMFINGGQFSMRMISSGMMMFSMVSMMMSGGGGGKGAERKQQINGSRRDYLRYLNQLRDRVRKAANRQREALEFRFPDPDTLWAMPLSRRLWERRPSDKDFSHVRVARGAQQFLMKLVPPETKPVEDLEPVAASALRRFIKTYGTVPEVPVSVALRGFSQVRLEGDAEEARALARAMVAHLAALHAPHEMIIAFCIGADRRAEWDWVKWLPHTLHPTRTDGAGQIRFVASSLSDLGPVLGDTFQGRPAFNPGGNPLTDQPHVVLVVDGGHMSFDARMITQPMQGVTVVDITGHTVRKPGNGILWLRMVDDELIYVTPTPDGMEERTTKLGRPDSLDVVQAEGLARQLAPLRSAVAKGVTAAVEEESAEEEAPQYENDLMELLEIEDAFNLDLDNLWAPRPAPERLKVPFGLRHDGTPIIIDIKESAQGGMGPHGIVIGATGSGKSEVLRTIVLALVATHSADYLNLVLVDFKGGATFLGIDELPHVSAVITNLEGELTLVDRMADAISGEINRRQEVLRVAGNFGSLRDYMEARDKGAVHAETGEPLEPLPTLWIVADEFSELLQAKPEFIETFLQIGRIGRSIGVHMLLATQRLEEGKLKGLDTFLSLKVGLRTFSASESRAVIGVPDAYELPREPGGGYLKVGQEDIIRFKAAYVGAPFQRKQAGGGGKKAKPKAKPGELVFQPQITAYTTDYIEPNIIEIPPEPEIEETSTTSVIKPQGYAPGVDPNSPLIDVIVAQLMGKGRSAHQVWLPPLEEPPTVDKLLPAPLQVTEERGLQSAWDGVGNLHAPIAIMDNPYYQRRDPFWVDLSGAAGHVAVCGTPQSGKSTVLRTLIAAFAATHTPDEAQFYCIDFGGGTLPIMTSLPHVGSVATRLDQDGIRRTVGEMKALLEEREQFFVANGIDSIGTYRQYRKQGRVQPDRFAPDVFLIIDGWGTIRSDYEKIEETVTEIAQRGLGFGIHVVVSVLKWNEMRAKFKDLVSTRVELKVSDPYDSEMNRKVASQVPTGAPGRGVSPSLLQFLGAVPRIDGVESDDGLADAVKAMGAQMSEAWKGEPAPPVRLLPARLDPALLPKPREDDKEMLVPIGIDEDTLQPVTLRFDQEPHFAAFGLQECGKSNLLDFIVKSIMSRTTKDEAKFAIIDYRRSLIDTVKNDQLIGYCASSDAADDLVKKLIVALKKRVPGPDVTPDQLKARNWWTGADLYIVIDDYDLVATSTQNPVKGLAELVSQASDIGLHIIIGRGWGGITRSMTDPVIARMRDMGNPALIMSGNRQDGNIWTNYKAQELVSGRGMFLSRRGQMLIQTAYNGPAEEEAA